MAVGTASAVYEGTVRHRRYTEHPQVFTHRVAMAYLDLAEMPTSLGSGFSFERSDFMGDPAQPLDECVRDAVAAGLAFRPTGAVRLLTTLRSFGHSFNPASFYYCFDESDRLQAVAVEVTNTPWRERHTYVMACDPERTTTARVTKRLHVSPFLDMDHTYNFTLRPPSSTLFVHIDNFQDDRRVFDATLHLERQPFDRATLRRIAWRYPLPSRRHLALIYGHAAALSARGVKVRRHRKAVSA
ncbi:MAG TPA: DUF1365 domain-containing protein [Acidimicrobiales bacterium]|nr:DUF1365 domain-containing protein [Acidimicrobiales bacterium]